VPPPRGGLKNFCTTEGGEPKNNVISSTVRSTVVGHYPFYLSVFLSVLSYWMIDKISHVLTERAWVRGVGIDFFLQSCCC
jgi:hypothetical protein